MSEQNPFKRLFSDRSEALQPESPGPDPAPEVESQSRKRGRPATGKRSDTGWIGRTYYVRRETDLDVAEMLLKLKRQWVELDKSELVDALLAAWVKWQEGGDSEILMSEISSRRKGEV